MKTGRMKTRRTRIGRTRTADDFGVAPPGEHRRPRRHTMPQAR